MRRIRFVIYKWLRKILRLNDSPYSIATGTAIGVFVAMLPIYGFQMIVGAAIATVARVNKLAAVVLAWITNPLTIPPILYLQYLLGNLVLGGAEAPDVKEKIHALGKAAGNLSFLEWKATSYEVLKAIGKLGPEVLLPTLIGGIISGVILGLLAYPLTLRMVIWYRRRKEARKEKRRLRLKTYLEEKAREEAQAEGQPEPEKVMSPGP